MGLFHSSKRKERDGERYYRMSLNHGSQELEYLEKSAALGNIHGKVGLARYYLAHCPDDRERMRAAVRLMQEAQAGGARLDDKQLLQMAIAAGEYETALAARTRLAEGGDRDEQFNLGCRYESGRDQTPVDPEQAWHWYSKAAAQDHPGACNNLAVLLLQGQVRPKDEKQALALMTKAAELGNRIACGNLAWDYYSGKAPCPQDYQQAYHYAALGAEQDHPRSRYVLALLLAQGLGVERDLARAVGLFEGLAEQNYQDAGELLQQYTQLYQQTRQEDFQRRYDEIAALMETEPRRARKLFRDLVGDGYQRARDGVQAAERRMAELADQRFARARAAGDRAAMRAAAEEEESPEACLYFFRQAASMAGAAVFDNNITLTDEELVLLPSYYWIATYFGRKPDPYDLDMVLSLISVRGRQLVEQNDRAGAIRLLDRVGPFNDPHCQYLLAQAYSDGTWQGEDKALAVLQRAIENPKIQDDLYKDTLKSMKENIAVYEYNKAIRRPY